MRKKAHVKEKTQNISALGRRLSMAPARRIPDMPRFGGLTLRFSIPLSSGAFQPHISPALPNIRPVGRFPPPPVRTSKQVRKLVLTCFRFSLIY
jgi:hypothetical protein